VGRQQHDPLPPQGADPLREVDGGRLAEGHGREAIIGTS
jgi:hypothetical protein